MKLGPYLVLLPFVGLALAIAFLPWPIVPQATTRRMAITAGQFAYDPPVLRVNRGDRVELTLQATDVVHGCSFLIRIRNVKLQSWEASLA